MIASVVTHPVFTFVAGVILAAVVLFVLLTSCAAPNRSAEKVADYQAALNAAGPAGGDEAAGIRRFTDFLQNIGNRDYVRENTSRVYSADAWLDDTLVVHRGAAEIERYFLKTGETMKSYQVTIDDVSQSGRDHYVRWTMVFSAPALAGGEPVHSVGMSQIRFDSQGKVAVHKDFWDSGQNFYGHLPIVGGAVGFVRKRLESN